VRRALAALCALLAALALPLVHAADPAVVTGLDVLAEGKFAALRGKRVGLVTNHTGRDRAGKSAVDLLFEAQGVSLAALFSPEHGLRGLSDDVVASGKDERTGLPVHSLYGKTKRPTPTMLAGLDVLAFDIQDVGARFYTYISTLGLCMEACAERGLPLVVLDRPNPIGGVAVEGPILEPALVGGFASYFALPTRHGMTIGEVARWRNASLVTPCALTVIEARGWRRGQYQSDTALAWVDPSPNMRSLEAAVHYPGLGALEATNLSVGRGTDRPFLVYGAPWLDGERLAATLTARALPGVRFRAVTFTPRPVPGMPRYPHTDKPCRGIAPETTDRAAFRPVLTALHVVQALLSQHPDEFAPKGFAGMIGRRGIEAALREGTTPEALIAAWEAEPAHAGFMKAREAALLYPE